MPRVVACIKKGLVLNRILAAWPERRISTNSHTVLLLVSEASDQRGHFFLYTYSGRGAYSASTYFQVWKILLPRTLPLPPRPQRLFFRPTVNKAREKKQRPASTPPRHPQGDHTYLIPKTQKSIKWIPSYYKRNPYLSASVHTQPSLRQTCLFMG